jgi:hypothetical protein
LSDAVKSANNFSGGDEDEYTKSLAHTDIDRAVDEAAAKLKQKMKDGLDQLKHQMQDGEVDAKKMNVKFAADSGSFEYEYGGMDVYHGGLEALIGNPNVNVEETVEWEHMRSGYAGLSATSDGQEYTPAGEWDYVCNKPHRSDNSGLYAGWTLGNFLSNNSALIAEAALRRIEVIVLRLYTGPMYNWYNTLLRYWKKPFDAGRKPFDDYKANSSEADTIPFQTTLHVLNSAILKVSRTQTACKVYRGVKGGRLPNQFWEPNAKNVRGGTELAFMSTTKNRSVAKNFAAGSGCSMLFEIQMGMIDRGAPVKWCSYYPRCADSHPCSRTSSCSP